MGNTVKNPGNEDAQSSIHLLLDDLEKGPSTEAEIRRRLQLGQCSHEALAWKGGMPDWVPACSVLGISVSHPIRRTPPHPPRGTLSSVSPLSRGFGAQELALYSALGWLLSVIALILWSMRGLFGSILVISAATMLGVFTDALNWFAGERQTRRYVCGLDLLSGIVIFFIPVAPCQQRLNAGDKALNNNRII